MTLPPTPGTSRARILELEAERDRYRAALEEIAESKGSRLVYDGGGKFIELSDTVWDLIQLAQRVLAASRMRDK